MYVLEHEGYLFSGCANEGVYRMKVTNDSVWEYIDPNPCRALIKIENGVAALSADSILRRWNGKDRLPDFKCPPEIGNANMTCSTNMIFLGGTLGF